MKHVSNVPMLALIEERNLNSYERIIEKISPKHELSGCDGLI